MNDLRTTHLNLPLPGNSLEIDLPRIQQAFTLLDEKIAALDVLLASDDLTLDTMRELVEAIKASRGDITQILAGKADRTAVDAQLNAKADKAAVDAQVAQLANTLQTADANLQKQIEVLQIAQLIGD